MKNPKYSHRPSARGIVWLLLTRIVLTTPYSSIHNENNPLWISKSRFVWQALVISESVASNASQSRLERHTRPRPIGLLRESR